MKLYDTICYSHSRLNTEQKEKNTHCKQDLSSTRVRTSKAAEPVSRKKMSRRFLIIKRTRTKKKKKFPFLYARMKPERIFPSHFHSNSPSFLCYLTAALLCFHNQLLSASTLCSFVSCSATSKKNGDGMRPLQANCDCVGNARECGVN